MPLGSGEITPLLEVYFWLFSPSHLINTLSVNTYRSDTDFVLIRWYPSQDIIEALCFTTILLKTNYRKTLMLEYPGNERHPLNYFLMCLSLRHNEEGSIVIL